MTRSEDVIHPIIDSVLDIFSSSNDPMMIEVVQANASDATAYLRIASITIALYE
jgi:hypothetical protein